MLTTIRDDNLLEMQMTVTDMTSFEVTGCPACEGYVGIWGKLLFPQNPRPIVGHKLWLVSHCGPQTLASVPLWATNFG